MSPTNDLTLKVLGKGLDALSARQTVIANNIANVETPNYKAVDVTFEESLRRAIRPNPSSLRLHRTSAAHLDPKAGSSEEIAEIGHSTIRRAQTALRKDGNNVDVETEMVHLAETGLRYQALSTLASKKLALMRMVAQETR